MREVSPSGVRVHRALPEIPASGVRADQTLLEQPPPAAPWMRPEVFVRNEHSQPIQALPEWMQARTCGATGQLRTLRSQSGVQMAILATAAGLDYVASLPMGLLPVPFWIEKRADSAVPSVTDPRTQRAFPAQQLGDGLVEIDLGTSRATRPSSSAWRRRRRLTTGKAGASASSGRGNAS